MEGLEPLVTKIDRWRARGLSFPDNELTQEEALTRDFFFPLFLFFFSFSFKKHSVEKQKGGKEALLAPSSLFPKTGSGEAVPTATPKAPF